MQNENENQSYPSFPNYESEDDASNPFLYEEVIYKKKKPKYWLHILLFVITFLATTFAGAEWIFGEKSFVALLFDADGLQELEVEDLVLMVLWLVWRILSLS